MGPRVKMSIVFLAIFLSVGGLEGSILQPTLKAVAMLTRHGNRTPEVMYPKDPYKDYPWPGGLGALTSRGEEQLFLSGSIKAKRYSTLLKPSCLFCSFSLDKIHVESSEVPRCIRSGTKFLEAFIPVPWSSSIIHVKPLSEDEYLAIGPSTAAQVVHCFDYNNPAYSPVMDFKSPKGETLLEYFEAKTGMDYRASSLIADTINVEMIHGLPMPAWAEPIFEKYMVPTSHVAMDLFAASDVIHHRSGILFRESMKRLEGFLNNTSKSNIIFYSAHDINIAGLMSLLQVRKQVEPLPDYGAMLNFEIYDNILVFNDVEIRIVYYRNYADENPIDIEIPGCKEPCAFKRFKASVESKYV